MRDLELLQTSKKARVSQAPSVGPQGGHLLEPSYRETRWEGHWRGEETRRRLAILLPELGLLV